MNSLTKLPLVQYSGMDYDNVIEDIKNIIQENPQWEENWGQFYESDAGVFLTQIMAYIADHLSIKLDYSINEHFITTASQDSNKLKILKLIGYNPSLATASSINVKLELESTIDGKLVFTAERKSTDSVTERSGKIMKIIASDIYGNNITFEAIPFNNETNKFEYFSEYAVEAEIAKATYDTDSNGNLLSLYQGETKQTSFTSNESNAVYFNISDTNVIEDSIRIYDRSTREELYEVKSFIQKEALSENHSIPYVVSKNEDGTIKISFANEKILTSITRRFQAGATIDVFYRVGGGTIGNIPAKFLNKTIKVPLESGGTINVTIYNETIGTGGSEAETADEAIVNGPLSIRTAEKAVSPEDYDIILNKLNNLLKVKTYSNVNVPSAFKTKYGRYLNPQEVFSFILLNKEHVGVPSSKYNQFPWVSLTKENRFNESHTFSTSSFNSRVPTPSLGNKLTLIQDSAAPKLFTNFMVIETDSEIKNNLYVVDEYDNYVINTNLIVKAMKEQSTSSYFTDIPFSLVYSSDDPGYSLATSKQKYLNATYDTVSIDTHAKYLANKWIEEGEAIDIKQYGDIGIVMDDKGLITIDLKADLSTAEKAKDNIYRLLTNPSPTIIPVGYTWLGTAAEAVYRLGIIETINSQVGLGELYNEDISIQYLGAGADANTKVLPAFAELFNGSTFSVPMIFNYNGDSYKMVFTNGIYDTVYDLMLPEVRADSTKDNIIGITAMINYLLSSAGGVNKYDTVGLNWEDGATFLTNLGFKYELVKRYVPNGNNNEYDYTTSIDMYFYSKNENGLMTGENYILIEYKAIGEFDSLIHNLSNVAKETYPDVTSFLPSVIEAANYEIIASIEERNEINNSGNEVNGQFLQIKSPLVGETSSIYFVNITNSPEKDFMRDLYLIKYITETGVISDYSISSNKAKGIKKATLLLEDQTVGYYDGEAIAPYEAGTIIYEHNCINTSIDFDTNVYYTYKTNDNKEIVLGSKYENFYFSGDSAIDESLKSKVTGLLGTSVKTITDTDGKETAELDFDKSNFVVKFTNDEQDTSSIYTINTSLDVIPIDRVTLKTDELIDFSSLDVATHFIFSIDDMITPVSIASGSISSSHVLYELIKIAFENRAASSSEIRDYSKFTDDIIRYDYETRKILCFGNVDKTSAGKISFYSDALSTPLQNINLYKYIFGTSLTNPEFYTLYEAGIPAANRNIISEITGEYSFYPISSESPLNFIYKKNINNVPRYGDYYIAKKITYNSDQTETIDYVLTKTTNSKFQDSSFYIHFVNDRTYTLNPDGTKFLTEEDSINDYLNKYIISGMDTSFAVPYFKTFDIKATIYYNSSFSKSEIKSAIEEKISTNYSIEKMEIGQKIKKSSIYKDIVTVNGVSGVDIDYFGLDASSLTGNVNNELTADFDEILIIHEDETNSSGTKIRGMIFDYEEDE